MYTFPMPDTGYFASFCCCDRNHDQEQVEWKELFGVYFQVTMYHWEKSGQKLEAGAGVADSLC